MSTIDKSSIDVSSQCHVPLKETSADEGSIDISSDVPLEETSIDKVCQIRNFNPTIS